MPLVRVEVRNEYGLGMPELYTEANGEDPKAVLDGVAVAGLVGILRQLGDLAEFAAEVFHGLQEQVLITSSRSHKLVERVHNIEAALPPLEKAILAQRSHLHFAYTAGCHWHARLKPEHNHFIYSDLPRCIMDSYEDCRDPPRLHKLDKFDIGGPGSCFKRYSDPTYFKRTSASTYKTHLQGVPREKKARRSKKKRSSRYRDIKHEAPTFTDSGSRMDFASSKFKGKTSPSQDVSSIHVAPKPRIEPEMEDHFSSFDPRNESGYIECIFRPSFSTHSDDNESKDSKAHHNTCLESTSMDENKIPDENCQNNYVTWDEKLEIIDSMGHPNDVTEIQHTIDKIDNKEKEDFDSGVVDHVDFDFNDEHEPLEPSVSVRKQPDEIESETDFYMDALNTIESESEADVDCQTKRELKQLPHMNKNVEGKQKADHLDDISMNLEPNVPESTSLSKAKSDLSPKSNPKSHTEAYHFSNNETYENSDKVTSSEMAGISLNSFTSPETFKSENVELLTTNSEIVAINAEPNSEPPSSEHISSTYESPNPPLSASGANNTLNQPFMFWTNGGLLGLEPSKPPDFGSPTANEPDSSKDDTIQHTSQNTIASSTMTSGINGHVPEFSNENNISSSRILEFSNRLLVNGFRKQISLVGDEKLASSVTSEVPENTSIHKGHHTVAAKPFREQFGSGSPLMSPLSPPLELMKISFQPINGFETSKLKLKLPNGDMFPSFQLVPEHAISLHESGSDSEDDTFCRSSPYASDDCHSHGGSESNSEQWDSGDSPRSKDHELDDAFIRISSSESVSNSGIPNLDSLNVSINHVSGNFDGNYLLESCFPKEPTPPPPPLPPLEWRGIKPHPDVTMEKEDDLSEAFTYALDLTLHEPMVSQQPKPAPLTHDHFVEKVDHTPKCKQPDWQDRSFKKEFNRATNGKVIDENEDFLQQIRTKSFNLRRTSTARPTIMPDAPTNVKVTAILEKANAIRQAVGSDDGDDDNWSDT